MLEDWMRSYRPEELFDERRPAACRARRAGAEGRRGAWARIRTPMAACCCATSQLPDFRDYAVDGAAARRRPGRSDARPRASSCAT